MTNLMTNSLKVVTQKSGYIEFGVFLDKTQADIQNLLLQIYYAHRAYEELPQTFPMVVELLDKEIVASSIYSTTSIEGTALESEEAVAEVLELSPEEIKTVNQRASANMKEAYDYARRESQKPDFRLTEKYIKKIHELVTKDIPHCYNVPGFYRDNLKLDVPTKVGNERTGGVYRPPKTLQDIQTLMTALVQWMDSEETKKESPLIIAPIVHFYFELIHPFWDGNGRVGRVLEAMILKAGGYLHAPFRMANYYRNHIEQYFSLFNQCRRALEKKDPNAHYPFVKFFLDGFLGAVEETKDRVIGFVRTMASRDYSLQLLRTKDINPRQYTILLQLLSQGPISKKELELQPWYTALYHRRTSRTRLRDLNKLLSKNLLSEKDGKLAVFHIP